MPGEVTPEHVRPVEGPALGEALGQPHGKLHRPAAAFPGGEAKEDAGSAVADALRGRGDDTLHVATNPS
jgi:hypothetical protein